MRKDLITIASAILLTSTLLGCGGGACRSEEIPIYSVTVYNSVTGEVVCGSDVYTYAIHSSNQCTVIYEPLDGKEQAGSGDLTISAAGFETQTLQDVANNRARYQCFDSPSYTTDVKVYLVPAS